MEMGMILALCVPFLGTLLGAGAVLGMPLGSGRVRSGLNGAAAGMMLVAAFVNLLLPGIRSDPAGTGVGFFAGLWMMLEAESRASRRGSGSAAGVLLLAVVLHNIPEGLAVGLSGEEHPDTMMGIALQNIPDGAVAAVPLAAMGMKKGKAFTLGGLTGAVEPLAAAAAMGMRRSFQGWMPGLMGFAAGAMVYVIIRELVPRMGSGKWAMGWFAAGTVLSLVLAGIT